MSPDMGFDKPMLSFPSVSTCHLWRNDLSDVICVSGQMTQYEETQYVDVGIFFKKYIYNDNL